MDILNWLYIAKSKLVRTTVDNPKDLMVFGAKVGANKRGDIYQTYSVSVEDFKASLPTPQVDEKGNLIVANSSNDLVEVANGGTQTIPAFSGMLLVNDHFDGRVETWIAGGGDAVLLGATNLGGDPCGSTLVIDGSGYAWTNVDNLTGPFTFTLITTRNEA